MSIAQRWGQFRDTVMELWGVKFRPTTASKVANNSVFVSSSDGNPHFKNGSGTDTPLSLQTSLTAHGVLVGQGASAPVATAAGTAGQVLTSNGASADPTFQAAPVPATLAATGAVQQANSTSVVATIATPTAGQYRCNVEVCNTASGDAVTATVTYTHPVAGAVTETVLNNVTLTSNVPQRASIVVSCTNATDLKINASGSSHVQTKWSASIERLV